ncbi:Trp biosynthesis-associated membrane protein [Microbacteriaceae bacterium VKM Ac-2855]|nr:Trp biosynthesis-associated membrane protein [Microbacteriaceae bacterium VKM Ac-2855]
MTGRRLKYLTILAIVIVAAVHLTASTQNWFTLRLVATAGHPDGIAVAGTAAAPALTALSLSSLALAAALAIAGPAFRVVLGVLQLLLGGCIALSAFTALNDPIAAGSSLITKATAIAGTDSVSALVSETTSTGWPVITLVFAVLTAALGVVVLGGVRSWPNSGAKKRASRFEPADGYGHGASTVSTDDGDIDPVVSWDELSRGDDPTGPDPTGPDR